jgi:hypothetical protein
MARFLFGPSEFFGIDVIFDIIVLLFLISIGVVTYKFYKLSTKKREYLFFSVSFFVLALSFLAKILTYSIIYFYNNLKLNQIEILNEFASSTIQGMRGSYFFFSAGIAAYGFLMLLGLYLLYLVYQKDRNLSDFVIIIFCFFMIIVFSHNQYFALHITALMMFLLITYRYLHVYLTNHRNSTLFITFSFMILSISQGFFIFKDNFELAYFLGESFQLLGYLLFVLVIFFSFRKVRTFRTKSNKSLSMRGKRKRK